MTSRYRRKQLRENPPPPLVSAPIKAIDAKIQAHQEEIKKLKKERQKLARKERADQRNKVRKEISQIVQNLLKGFDDIVWEERESYATDNYTDFLNGFFSRQMIELDGGGQLMLQISYDAMKYRGVTYTFSLKHDRLGKIRHEYHRSGILKTIQSPSLADLIKDGKPWFQEELRKSLKLLRKK